MAGVPGGSRLERFEPYESGLEESRLCDGISDSPVPGRDGKARAVDGFVYCSLKVLAEDCANRTPSYYLFSRKH